jgi:hypothetical protein
VDVEKEVLSSRASGEAKLLKLRLQRISSADAQVGDKVDF